MRLLSLYDLDRVSVYSGFGLDRFSVYSGFGLDRFSVYSGFGLDRFHYILNNFFISEINCVFCFISINQISI